MISGVITCCAFIIKGAAVATRICFSFINNKFKNLAKVLNIAVILTMSNFIYSNSLINENDVVKFLKK